MEEQHSDQIILDEDFDWKLLARKFIDSCATKTGLTRSRLLWGKKTKGKGTNLTDLKKRLENDKISSFGEFRRLIYAMIDAYSEKPHSLTDFRWDFEKKVRSAKEAHKKIKRAEAKRLELEAQVIEEKPNVDALMLEPPQQVIQPLAHVENEVKVEMEVGEEEPNIEVPEQPPHVRADDDVQMEDALEESDGESLYRIAHSPRNWQITIPEGHSWSDSGPLLYTLKTPTLMTDPDESELSSDEEDSTLLSFENLEPHLQLRKKLQKKNNIEGISHVMEFQRKSQHCPNGIPDGIDVTAKVLIIGSGDALADCIDSCRNIGVTKITSFEVMTNPENPWPKWPPIYRGNFDDKSESVSLKRLKRKCFAENFWILRGLEIVNVNWQRNTTGNWKLVEKTETTRTIKCDICILAKYTSGSGSENQH